MDIDLLEGEEFDGLVVDLPEGCYFPSIYKPQAYGPGPENPHFQRFGLTVRLDDLPPELHHQVAPGRRPLDDGEFVVHTKTNLRPRVVPQVEGLGPGPHAELKLVELLSRLEACNVPKDRLFLNRRMQVELRGQRYGAMESSSSRFLDDATRQHLYDKFMLSPTLVRVWLRLEE